MVATFLASFTPTLSIPINTSHIFKPTFYLSYRSSLIYDRFLAVFNNLCKAHLRSLMGSTSTLIIAAFSACTLCNLITPHINKTQTALGFFYPIVAGNYRIMAHFNRFYKKGLHYFFSVQVKLPSNDGLILIPTFLSYFQETIDFNCRG